MYLDEAKTKPVHLDKGKEARALTIPGMVDRFIEITDEYTKIKKEREQLRQQIVDKSRSYGIKKGDLGSICLSEPKDREMLNTKKIRKDMSPEWIEEYSMTVTGNVTVSIQSRSPEYFARVLAK